MTAPLRPVTLDDKFRNLEGRAYMTGIQALVRVALDRARLDAAAGLRTGGFISGYRGSRRSAASTSSLRPIRTCFSTSLSIRFQPGVNEELAATAVWGSPEGGARAGRFRL